MKLELKLEGVEKIQRVLTSEQFDAAFTEGLDNTRSLIVRESKIRAPRKTGHLSRGINSRLESKKQAVIFDPVEYAHIHEYGGRTGRGYKIKIKEKKYVRGSVADKLQNIAEAFAKSFEKWLRRAG